MKPLAIDAFCQYHFLSSLTLSPEGKTAVFVEKTADKKENNYRSVLKLIRFDSAEGPKVLPLTSLGKESSFLYDCEDTLLLPLNRRKEDEPEKNHEKTAYYRLPLYGGEAMPAFSLDYDVSSIKKAGEGIYVFSREYDTNKPDPEDKEREEELKDYEDYHVLEELPYWTDNGSFISRYRTALYLFTEATGEVKRLTNDPLFDLHSFDVSEGTLYYTGESFCDIRPFTTGLFAYDLATGETKTILPEGQRIIESLAACKNGLFLTMMPENAKDYWGTADLYFYDGSSFSLLDDQLPSLGDAPMSDSTLGFTPSFKVRNDALFYSALLRDTAKVFCRTEKEGSCTLLPFPSYVQQYDVRKETYLFIGMEEGKLQEVYAMSKEGKVTQLTHVNEKVLEDTYVAPCRYAGFTNQDGIEIDGWVLEPMDYDPSKTYPGILDIHGGPRAAYGKTFFHEMQYWASQGYFVLFCNPRGSSGRGDDFADIRKKSGTIDYQDLMAFTDHVLEMYPALDKERLGVTGGSYGGWMTNWIIGHTDRFKAAASQRSFSNWLSDFSASEIGYSFDVIEIGALPWEDPKRLWEASPAAYVDKITTPTLFIHSLLDHNCPLSESMQMFAAMRYRHIPSRACLFEGEGHGLSRGGKPRHRIRRLKEITEWMDRYLKKES